MAEPVAAEFPLFDDARRAELATRIKKHGQRRSIVLSADGTMILDGRNRYLACIAAGVEPTFERFREDATELDITEFIRDENFERRDLNPGQKAAIGVAIDGYVERLKDEAKERQRKGGGDKKSAKAKSVGAKSSQPKKRAQKTTERIAKDAKVGDASVKQALKVKGASPQLLRDVQDGKLSLNDAYRQVRQEEARAKAIAEQESPSQRTTIVRTHDGRERAYQLPKGAVKFNQTNHQVSWAAWTWNPVTGCLHNCEYCYAHEGAVMNKNLKSFYPFGFDPTFYDFRLEAPKNSNVPAETKNDPRLGRASQAIHLPFRQSPPEPPNPIQNRQCCDGDNRDRNVL